MTPANINTVFEITKAIVNKEQQGNFTPTEYNRFVVLAQLEVTNDLLEAKNDFLASSLRFKMRRLGLDDVMQIEDMLSLLNRDEVSMVGTADPLVYDAPSDIMKVIQIYADNEPIDILQAAEFNYASRSLLIAPSYTHFICKRLTGTKFKFSPQPSGTGITTPKITYMKIPQSIDAAGDPSVNSPTWNGVLVSPNDPYETFDVSSSYNFELGIQAEPLLINKILMYLGINLNRELLMEYVMNQEKLNLQQQQQ